MAPPRKRIKLATVAGQGTAAEPALGRSTVINEEGLDKICPMVASVFNEWGATKIWPASRPALDLEVTTIRIHIPALLSGLVPPFSDFFNAVLGHYQVHLLHIDPKTILLLSALAFLCEAFVGVSPSVALLRHFFSLRLTALEQRSGCVSFQAVSSTAGDCIDMRIKEDAGGFRRQWVYVDATQYSPLLLTPALTAVPNSGWEHQKLIDPRLSPVLKRLATLRDAGVMVTMAMREFLQRRIAPSSAIPALCVLSVEWRTRCGLTSTPCRSKPWKGHCKS
jgi:hypothetical protein